MACYFIFIYIFEVSPGEIFSDLSLLPFRDFMVVIDVLRLTPSCAGEFGRCRIPFSCFGQGAVCQLSIPVHQPAILYPVTSLDKAKS